MNLQIMNGCQGTDPELQTAGTDSGHCMLKNSVKVHPLKSEYDSKYLHNSLSTN